ncbi:hypothetical protein BBI11_15680 [Planococcus maritimus]|uniref:hypothetical protein n=1 Tax=Planococcus maritimus TaxID=192421 RepID=UPI00080F0D66|nr:hypothetical protein [Planococcus maritimus]ANU18388.1 hypothetical protein BBI11_15680 [Planococcus maritimus]
MNEKAVWTIAVVFAVATLILNNVLDMAVGGWLMTISFLAFAVAVVGSIYYISKLLVIQFIREKNR